jgi:hypothetical protein
MIGNQVETLCQLRRLYVIAFEWFPRWADIPQKMSSLKRRDTINVPRNNVLSPTLLLY